ncbi:MAG: bifunctional oligoribonuclease/PAP phosphatase NrnA [Planctomycetaceae bacterium]
MTQTIDWQPLKDLIASRQRFVLTSHVRPDADALGSELGLAAVLRALGKEVRIINPSATPAHLQFLDPAGEISKLGDRFSVDSACDTDVHLVVDTSARKQLDDMCKVLERTSATKVVIDHHVCGDELGAIEYRDVSAAATGVLITELAEFLSVRPDRDAAIALFAAIATDTGWYRFPNTDSRTLGTAARLVDLGAQPSQLFRELYERSSLSRLKLKARILDRVQVVGGGRLAYTVVFRRDFKETNSQPADTEDLVNEGLTIEGVDCAFILVEQPGGQVKASLRSRGPVDVAAVGREFGGGGHVQAAGAMLPGPVEKAEETLLAALHKALELNPVEITASL